MCAGLYGVGKGFGTAAGGVGYGNCIVACADVGAVGGVAGGAIAPCVGVVGVVVVVVYL